MDTTEEEIRERCTEAVFERADRYRSGGRIRTLRRFGETVTATVSGSSEYDVSIEMSMSGIDAVCSCPDERPGDCKHVAAVLLECNEEPPDDAEQAARSILEDVETEHVHEFLLDAFARDGDLYDRFVSRFGTPPEISVAEYRSDVDALFQRHAGDHGVVTEAIDFSTVLDQAARYRERGYHDEAATIYRAVVVSIDENYHLIDAAYDHFARTFQAALDGYVACAERAANSPDDTEEYLAFLHERAVNGSAVLGEQYADAISKLEQ